MSTTTIIILVSAGLFVMVAVAFIMQALEKSAKERKRTEAALKARARNFQYMLDSLPDGFLGRDLKTLLCNSLLETYEQLSRLGKRADYAAHIELTTKQLSQLQAREGDFPYQPLANTAQIKEVQKLLRQLYSYLDRLQRSRRIPAQQTRAYALKIRRLICSSSVDALRDAANQAQAENKARLAIHYLQMAIDKMKKENDDGYFSEMIAGLSQQIGQLKVASPEGANTTAEPGAVVDEDQWKEFTEEDESWKKKAIYD